MHKPKKFDVVHQTVFACERVGSGDETTSSLSILTNVLILYIIKVRVV